MKWLTLFLILTGCASIDRQPLPSEQIHTWVLTEKGLRHHSGAVDLVLSFDKVQNYRCYSPDDDLIWRNRMSALEALQSGF